MSDFKFVLNPKGIAAMAVGAEMSEAMGSIAEKAKSIAESLSSDFVVSGDYIGSFEAEVAERALPAAGTSPAHTVAAAVLRNTSGHAVAVEYGYKGRADEPTRKAHRIFGRTLAQLGQ
jgi:hypothetical protein